jgi:hypothetical protein
MPRHTEDEREITDGETLRAWTSYLEVPLSICTDRGPRAHLG